MKSPEKANTYRKKTIGYLGLGWEQEENRHKGSSGGDGNVLKLNYINSCTILEIYLKNLNHTFKMSELYGI